ncbi:hypothetical protein, partial [Sphingomonas sp.]|uniref:hypothetical protein n=1 Tax=Sphingomonas sp. TaxID=28214 RepID=UPI00286AA356
MTFKWRKRWLVLALLAAAGPLSAGVPVRVTGNTGADDLLTKDIVQTITYFGDTFDCPAPSEIRTSQLNASMVPSGLRKAALRAAYEEWDADFCGKTERFFITYWPDPAGGSFLSVTYPYPATAPSATFR